MFSSRKIRGVVISGVAVAAALTLTAGQSAAASGCFTVSGRYTEHAVAGPECLSPVGLCIAGTYRGDISGSLQRERHHHHTDRRHAHHLRVDLHVRLDHHGSRQGEPRHPHRQERGGLHHPAGRFHRGSPDHRGWNGQTRGGAGVCPGQRNLLAVDGGTSDYEGSVCVG